MEQTGGSASHPEETAPVWASPAVDLGLGTLLFAAIAMYLAALPRTAIGTDEATYLKESLRILRGQVLYRDIFDLTTPGWMYFIALLFKVFGATFATARVAAALIQGLTAALVFATCRIVGVRRGIGLALALLCALSAHVNYPIASQHWLATMLSAALLLTYLRAGRSPRGVVATGFLLGLLISVHQQRGLSIAFGALACLVGDAALRRLLGHPFDGRGLVRRALLLGAGGAAVVVPMLGFIIWRAGFRPVWRALILFPLVEYRQSAHCAWGFESTVDFLPAQMLRFLPIVLLLVPLRTVALWRQGGDCHQLRSVMIMTIHCGASILSIWYYPDRIHIAFIVPSFAVIVGDLLEWALTPHPFALNRFAPGAPRARQTDRTVGYVLALVAAVSIAFAARSYFSDQWRRFPYAYHGPFGRIDVRNRESVALLQRIEALLQTVPDRTLFCHGTTSYHCLFVDGRNPTRYELLVNNYNSPAQIAEATQVLTVNDVPYLIALPAAIRLDDPIAAFIRRNYRQLDEKGVDRYIWKRIPGRNQVID